MPARVLVSPRARAYRILNTRCAWALQSRSGQSLVDAPVGQTGPNFYSECLGNWNTHCVGGLDASAPPQDPSVPQNWLVSPCAARAASGASAWCLFVRPLSALDAVRTVQVRNRPPARHVATATDVAPGHVRSGASVFFGMRFTGRSGEVGGQLPKTCVHVHISTTILCIYGCAKAAGVLLQYFQISVPASLHRQAQGGNKNSVLLRRQGYNACAVWAGRRISAKSCTNACPCARARVCVCACVGTGYVCLCVRVSVISQRCMVAHTLVMHPSRNMPHKTPWGNKRAAASELFRTS